MSAVVAEKLCPKCRLTKTREEFGPAKGKMLGRDSWCRDCRSEAAKRRYLTPEGHLRNVWNAMRKRCGNPKNPGFKNYGARGISVCAEWQTFEPFLAWALANGFAPELALDRHDNDGDYSPDNCRWVTRSQNMRNIRSFAKSGYIGVYQVRRRWKALVGINGKSVHLGYHPTPEEAARARDAYAVPLGFRPNLPVQESS